MTEEQATALNDAMAHMRAFSIEFTVQMTPAIRALVKTWRDLCATRAIPRQYRDTMQRRKIRHAAALGLVRLRT